MNGNSYYTHVVKTLGGKPVALYLYATWISGCILGHYLLMLMGETEGLPSDVRRLIIPALCFVGIVLSMGTQLIHPRKRQRLFETIIHQAPVPIRVRLLVYLLPLLATGAALSPIMFGT